MTVFWCPKCGIVWASDEPPICRHNVLDSPTPVARMEPIPDYHPYSPTKLDAPC